MQAVEDTNRGQRKAQGKGQFVKGLIETATIKQLNISE